MSYASQQQRIIVTRDRDFVQLHEQDYEHSGIVYWPHNEAVAIRDMQQLLVDLLQRIAKAPAQGSGIPNAFNTTSPKKKGKKRKRKGSPRKPQVSNELPAGLEVQGTVQSVSGDTLQVQLTTGQTAWLLPQRLGRPTPQVGDEIQAVTVRFVKSRKQLHLSMRRAYTSARTVPHLGLKRLRRHDHALLREICERWLVEFEFVGAHGLRIYGVTTSEVRDATNYLRRHIPWTASATVELDTVAFRNWTHAAYGGGVGKMALATCALIQYHSANSMVICAGSNRDLDSLLCLIHAHVPNLQVFDFQTARSEPITACRWPCAEMTNECARQIAQ